MNGGGDHQHLTLRAAQACADKHSSAISRHNVGRAYSDRRVVRVDGQRLTEWERDELERIYGESE